MLDKHLGFFFELGQDLFFLFVSERDVHPRFWPLWSFSGFWFELLLLFHFLCPLFEVGYLLDVNDRNGIVNGLFTLRG